MRLSVESEVDSTILLRNVIKFQNETFSYEFIPDQKGILTKIVITVNIPAPSKFYSVIKSTPNEISKYNITINQDKELYDMIISEFKELESILAFSTNSLKYIKWDFPKHKIICETEEEKKNVGVLGFDFQKRWPDTVSRLNEEDIKNILLEKKDYFSLITVKAFWRESANFFKRFRYVDSFYYSYFVIEGLYSNGKTRIKDVIDEFLHSPEFCKSIDFTIEEINKNPMHKEKIDMMLKARNLTLNREGIITLIVKTRGALHHFTDAPNKIQATPFCQHDFEYLAWASMGLAYHSILMKILCINQSKQAQNDRK
jgi:hypothetical protein